MKDIAQSNLEDVVSGHDRLTGFRPFMLAALGNCCDLGSIYGLMKFCPDICHDEIEYFPKNKKRRLGDIN